jgi:hypothetical protein
MVGVMTELITVCFLGRPSDAVVVAGALPRRQASRANRRPAKTQRAEAGKKLR